MIDIPKDIQKYLVSDEVVEREFKLTRKTVYASTNRMFIKKGRNVKDISYAHISSIEYDSKRQLWVSLVGIIVGIAGYFWQQSDALGWALIFAGIALLIIGFIWKSQTVNITVSGVSDPEPLKGSGETLDSLFRLVRERRV
ncbi:hypothetical protein ACFLWS_07710 [Chloroflexota bacterium]